LLSRFTRRLFCALVLTLVLGAVTVSAQDATSAASGEEKPAATSSASQQTDAAAAAPKSSGHASKSPQWTRVHRVDDFLTTQERAAGTASADGDAPIVVFSHAAHARANVSCETCHHTGLKGWQAEACATCHKGKAAVAVMHGACITCHQTSGKGPTSCNSCHTARQTSAAGIVRFELYDLLRGPLFIVAWVIFALGFAWRIFQFQRMTSRIGRPIPLSDPVPTARDAAFLSQGSTALSRARSRARKWLRGTVFGASPVMGVVSLVFHLMLVLVPLLLPAHAILFRQTFRWNLPTLPEPLLDHATLVFLGIGVFFLCRRIFFPRVRSLSTVRDYLVLLLVVAPFFTAYAAHHQWLDYRTVLNTHMLVGEIVIALIPFTKLGHMPFLLFSRFFASGEYSWKPGNRRW
jgi:nitrate reductase gamma subunit